MLRISFLLSMILIFAMVGCSSSPAATPVPNQAPLPAPTTAPTAVAKPASPAAPAPFSATTLAPKQAVKVEAWDDYFRPEKITVTVGTQVTWINVGLKKHTVSSGNLFDQDISNPGDTFSFTFDKPGVVQYYCVQHSLSETEGMVGTITVVAP